jgi:hypothetical protein
MSVGKGSVVSVKRIKLGGCSPPEDKILKYLTGLSVEESLLSGTDSEIFVLTGVTFAHAPARAATARIKDKTSPVTRIRMLNLALKMPPTSNQLM